MNTQQDLEQQKIEAGRAAIHSLTEEEMDSAFEEIKNPIERAPAKIAELKEIKEFVSREQKIDQCTQQFESRILLDLIHLYPNPGETTSPERYLNVIQGRYEELVADLREKFIDAPDMNIQEVAFQICRNAMDELHRSNALETAKAIFAEEHAAAETKNEELTRISQPNIVSSPFASETSFKAAEPIKEKTTIQASSQGPAMFSLKDLGLEVQDTPIQQTGTQIKKEQS